MQGFCKARSYSETAPGKNNLRQRRVMMSNINYRQINETVWRTPCCTINTSNIQVGCWRVKKWDYRILSKSRRKHANSAQSDVAIMTIARWMTNVPRRCPPCWAIIVHCRAQQISYTHNYVNRWTEVAVVQMKRPAACNRIKSQIMTNQAVNLGNKAIPAPGSQLIA